MSNVTERMFISEEVGFFFSSPISVLVNEIPPTVRFTRVFTRLDIVVGEVIQNAKRINDMLAMKTV